MDLLAWVAAGAVLGVLAKLLIPGVSPGGAAGSAIIGVIGGALGGWLMHLFGAAGETGFHVWSLVAACVGAAALLYGFRMFMHDPVLR